MARLFGTDGVRGVANSELTAELAFKLGQAGALVLTKATSRRPKILIGKDTRISGDMLEAALAAGICSVGAEAVLLGVLPTPAVAYITKVRGADAGIVISASHNSMEFNGIKFFDGKGFKLPDSLEDEIEAIIKGDGTHIPVPVGADVGIITHDTEAITEYERFVMNTIPCDLKDMKIAIDCANGASYATAPKVLQDLGAIVSVIHNSPNGTNINKDCGSTHIEDLQKCVVETGSDFGFAFDGDADRVMAIDEKGNLVDGDQMLTICGLAMKNEGNLPQDTVVVTVMSNLGMHIAARENGFNLEITKVGDRYVLEKMIECGYKIGGEQSGHIIFTEFNNTGDGLVSALQLAKVIKNSGKKLSELASVMKILPQVLINAKVLGSKDAYKQDAEIMALIDSIESEFAGNGRVLIRPSGTEPLVRVMIEGNDQQKITERARQLADLIESKLGM